jgi:hypothetical protein
MVATVESSTSSFSNTDVQKHESELATAVATPEWKPKLCCAELPDGSRCRKPLTPETASQYVCNHGGRCREHARTNRKDQYWQGRIKLGRTSEALHTFQVRDSWWKYSAKYGDPKQFLLDAMVRFNLKNWLREQKESLSKDVNEAIDADRRAAKGYHEEFVTPETVMFSERADTDLVDLINEVETVLSEKPETADEKYGTYLRMSVTWDHILEVVQLRDLMAQQSQPSQLHSNARF